jgi:regulator of PEP synthase PpsR (kinase-PPPase family)
VRGISSDHDNQPIIYVVSDSVGETAEVVVKAVISQFDSGYAEIRKIPFVNNTGHIAEIVRQAKAEPGIIVYTLVLPELREAMAKITAEKQVAAVDIMGPMMETLARELDIMPKMKPGLIHKMDKNYFRKVEAIEFAVKYDDGKDSRGVLYSDVAIIGVSRTSKTPLCMYLAHKGIKAANIPLVPEVAPPDEIYAHARKVIGLTIKPEQLNEIRQERLKTLGLRTGSDYASLERILMELDYAEVIMKKAGCPIIDVTNKAVEETASKVLEIINKGDGYGN